MSEFYTKQKARQFGRSHPRHHTESQNNNNPLNLDKKLMIKYNSLLPNLIELFPNWSNDDLLTALNESDGNLNETILNITEGHATQWGEVKKKQRDRQSKHLNSNIVNNNDSGLSFHSHLNNGQSSSGFGSGYGTYNHDREKSTSRINNQRNLNNFKKSTKIPINKSKGFPTIENTISHNDDHVLNSNKKDTTNTSIKTSWASTLSKKIEKPVPVTHSHSHPLKAPNDNNHHDKDPHSENNDNLPVEKKSKGHKPNDNPPINQKPTITPITPIITPATTTPKKLTWASIAAPKPITKKQPLKQEHKTIVKKEEPSIHTPENQSDLKKEESQSQNIENVQNINNNEQKEPSQISLQKEEINEPKSTKSVSQEVNETSESNDTTQEIPKSSLSPHDNPQITYQQNSYDELSKPPGLDISHLSKVLKLQPQSQPEIPIDPSSSEYTKEHNVSVRFPTFNNNKNNESIISDSNNNDNQDQEKEKEKDQEQEQENQEESFTSTKKESTIITTDADTTTTSIPSSLIFSNKIGFNKKFQDVENGSGSVGVILPTSISHIDRVGISFGSLNLNEENNNSYDNESSQKENLENENYENVENKETSEVNYNKEQLQASQNQETVNINNNNEDKPSNHSFEIPSNQISHNDNDNIHDSQTTTQPQQHIQDQDQVIQSQNQSQSQSQSQNQLQVQSPEQSQTSADPQAQTQQELYQQQQSHPYQRQVQNNQPVYQMSQTPPPAPTIQGSNQQFMNQSNYYRYGQQQQQQQAPHVTQQLNQQQEQIHSTIPYNQLQPNQLDNYSNNYGFQSPIPASSYPTTHSNSDYGYDNNNQRKNYNVNSQGTNSVNGSIQGQQQQQQQHQQQQQQTPNTTTTANNNSNNNLRDRNGYDTIPTQRPSPYFAESQIQQLQQPIPNQIQQSLTTSQQDSTIPPGVGGVVPPPLNFNGQPFYSAVPMYYNYYQYPHTQYSQYPQQQNQPQGKVFNNQYYEQPYRLGQQPQAQQQQQHVHSQVSSQQQSSSNNNHIEQSQNIGSGQLNNLSDFLENQNVNVGQQIPIQGNGSGPRQQIRGIQQQPPIVNNHGVSTNPQTIGVQQQYHQQPYQPYYGSYQDYQQRGTWGAY